MPKARGYSLYVVAVETRPPMWNWRGLIVNLGGIGELAEKLMAKGYRPPVADTMQGWATRNSVPSPWQLAVIGIAMDEGLISHPEEILLKETK